jgi:iron complex transport system ATP-binding protein
MEIMTAIVSLKDAAFSYGETEIFGGISLDVSAGEIVCILGANGCGKTTLLRCINSSLRLKKGKIYVGEDDIATLSVDKVALKIGFVFQEHSAPFPFSVLEVVRMGRAPHMKILATPSKKDTAIAEESLALVGMLHLKNKPYTQISGGERQLILIARTLAQNPEVILMDEPTSHLDFRNQTIILQMICKLAEKGIAVIMTSHLPDHALLYSSRVALMKDGGFLAVGKPDEVMTEESLKNIYGIEVKMVTVNDPNSHGTIKIVLPMKELTNHNKN